MSKVRREKHKELVFNERRYKYLSRFLPRYNKAPRKRNWKKELNERIFKDE